MSIASSSQVDPAYKIYRRYKDKCEDVWDNGDDKPLHDGGDEIDDDDNEPPPPPCIVLVQGPPSVGKSLLIKSLVKYFTMESPSPSPGPITIVIGNTRRRLQFVECPDDINGMIDAAKYADLVLLLVDASYGFEAETFEFLNLLQAHGFPEVMGVFTHLDEFKDEKELKVETIECLKDHFWTEIYRGATISCLSGLYNDSLYRMGEVQELAQHIISMLQPRSSSHPYVLVDCIEDVYLPEELHKDANCKRNINLRGYLRGGNISKSGVKVHLAGVGDFRLAGVTSTTDPFPFSSDSEMGKDFVDIENQSFRPGTYVRLEVHDVPFQVVDNFDPCHPILVVGGISLEEENAGYIQVRLKRHNWHMKLLKSAEAVTVSAGWRRYQSKPIYASEIDSGRHEILDFNSEHE
ncbi:hypothetical protein MKX03_012918 [Papaver bracteatum]|nr:hypothetical protein MKX03_012918 [Papaver bracteatum]